MKLRSILFMLEDLVEILPGMLVILFFGMAIAYLL